VASGADQSPAATVEFGNAERDFAWVLITSQHNRGQITTARESLDQLQPEVVDAHTITVWSNLYRLTGWTPAAAEQAVAFVEHGLAPPQVEGRILFSLMDICRARSGDTETSSVQSEVVVIDDSVHEQLVSAWNRHLAAVRTTNDPIDHPGQPPDAAEQTYGQARTAVWFGRAPLGTIAIAARAPYALTIYQNLCGFIPSADPDAHDTEVAAAAAALNATVAIDATALHVIAALTGLWDAVCAEFGSVLLADSALHDILSSHVAARSTRRVTTDGSFTSDGPVAGTGHDQVVLRCSEAVLAAAQQCRVRIVDSLDGLDIPYALDTAGSWLGPVELARANRIPLLSDDRVLRRHARERGIPTFGTLALVEAITVAGGQLPSPIDLIVQRLFDGFVVDLPSVWPLLITAARNGGATAPHVLVNLARADFWQGLEDEMTFGGVLAEMARLSASSPNALDQVLTAIVTGVLAFRPNIDSAAVVGTVVLTAGTGVNASAVQAVLPILRRVSEPYGFDPTERLRTFLYEALTDPDSDTPPLENDNARAIIRDAFRTEA
jgi:hypothetical protein